MLIRLSPSGPPISNTEGGTAETGPGFMLRLDEGTTIIDGAFGNWQAATNVEVKIDPSVTTGPYLRPRLANPSPDRRYRVTGAVDIVNTVPATVVITSTIEVSYDEGVSWDILVIQEAEIPNVVQNKHVRIDQPLTLGSALNHVVPPGAPSIQVRLLMRASLPNVRFQAEGGTSGAALLQLTEHL